MMNNRKFTLHAGRGRSTNTGRLAPGLWALVLCCVLSACATTGLTKQDVLRQYDGVAQLHDGVEQARGRHAALLAPEQLARTDEALQEAIEHARDADKAAAQAATERGLADLMKLEQAVEQNREVMEQVLDTRARAKEQGADVLFEERFAEADERFRSTSRVLEAGDRQEARAQRPGLMELYADLELDALQKGTVEGARKAIAAAEEAGAEEAAPETLAEAREEMRLAMSVLEADRTRVEAGDEHARRATWLARRAAAITELARRFEQRDMSDEEIVLWYQSQLQRVRDAFRDETLPFDRSNAEVIEALRQDAHAVQAMMENVSETNELMHARVERLHGELDRQRKEHEVELQTILAEHERQLTALRSGSLAQLKKARENAEQAVSSLRERLSEQAMARAQAEREQRMREARFDETRKLFAEAEAEVFRQGNDVLIRMRGFDFRPGKYEVQSRNYPLLNKVVTALNTFPESTVTITGHTDARGTEQRNQELSAARAQSVVEFLTSVGGVDDKRVRAIGKGESSPLASNETAEGRAKNRRIDVLIQNPASDAGATPAVAAGEKSPSAPSKGAATATPQAGAKRPGTAPASTPAAPTAESQAEGDTP